MNTQEDSKSDTDKRKASSNPQPSPQPGPSNTQKQPPVSGSSPASKVSDETQPLPFGDASKYVEVSEIGTGEI